MKTEKQIRRKRASLLKELKGLRKFIMERSNRGFDTSYYQKQEGNLMGQINSLNWIIKR